MSTTYFAFLLLSYVHKTICTWNVNISTMVYMQNLHCFQPGKSEWERKVKRERKDSSTAETQLASQSCPARLEAAACWANVLSPLLHKYTPTFTHKTHTLSTWSSWSQSEAPQCVLFSWGRGMKRDVLMWKNSECDRPEAGVTRGHRETSFLLFLIRVSSVEAITACWSIRVNDNNCLPVKPTKKDKPFHMFTQTSCLSRKYVNTG